MFNAQQYDTEKFVAGIWEEYRGGEFKIAKAGNPLFLDAKRRLDKEYSLKYEGTLPSAVEQEKLCLAVAEGILRDWRQVVDAEGEEIKYDVQAAAAVLSEHPALLDFVLFKANELDRFEREGVKQEAKKPQTSSSTT